MRARSVSSAGITTLSSTWTPPSSRAVSRCSWSISWPPAGAVRGCGRSSPRPRGRPTRRSAPAGRARARSSARPNPPMRSLSVGARQSERRGGLASRSWTSEPSASTATGGSAAASGRRRRRGAVVDAHLADARPRSRPAPTARLGGGREANGQPDLPAVGLGAPPARGSRPVARSPGPASGRGELALVDDVAVDRDRERRPQPVEAGPVLVVPDRDLAARQRRSGVAATRTGAASALVLPHRGLGRPVGPDQPSVHEVAVVGLVAEVAAIGPAGRAVGQRLDEAVVPPLPDEPALQAGRAIRWRPSTRRACRCCCPSRASTRT